MDEGTDTFMDNNFDRGVWMKIQIHLWITIWIKVYG